MACAVEGVPQRAVFSARGTHQVRARYCTGTPRSNFEKTYKRRESSGDQAGRARTRVRGPRYAATGQLASPGRAAASAASRESSDPSEVTELRGVVFLWLSCVLPAAERCEPGDRYSDRQRRGARAAEAAEVGLARGPRENTKREAQESPTRSPVDRIFQERKCLACPGLSLFFH